MFKKRTPAKTAPKPPAKLPPTPPATISAEISAPAPIPPPDEPATLREAYSRGDSGPGVELLQERLREAGFRLKVDGVFTVDDENALIEYQGKVGVPRTGIADPATWDALLA